MERIGSVVLASVLMAIEVSATVGGEAGCSAEANKRIVDAVVRKALAECVAENAHLGDVELKEACGFAEDLWPVVRDLVAAQRRGLAKAAARRDAGPADAAKE